jgi:HSP20 family protein
MKFNKDILTEIANQIDLLITINGGVSMTSVDIVQGVDNFTIKVKTPGINKYAYQVEINNNKLLIYTLIQVERNEGAVQLPSFVKYFPIPKDVNFDEIEAVYEDGELKVIVPYNTENKVQNQRKIDINYL